jgi:hyperosmotically inducible protein
MRISQTSVALFVAGMLLAAPSLYAEPIHDQTPPIHKSKSTKPVEPKNDEASAASADNTTVNKRDRNDTESTADQQGNSKADVELTTNIRRALMADKSLSTNAHNVKIIAEDGNVTLKGPVASNAEKATVERLATKIAKKSKGKVTSEISVAP